LGASALLVLDALLMKLLGAICSLDGLLLGAILENEADDGEKQEAHGQKALEAGPATDGDDCANRHDGEKARASAQHESRCEKGDEVEDDRRTGDAVPCGKLTLRSKLERLMLGSGVWLIGRHSMTLGYK
jgi:hypothetical protein